MALNDVSLTSGMRSNLLSLQNTVDLLNRTQNRLSTGKKVNSAIDNPVSFFASQALTSRASKIDSLKDAMGQAIQTITAADKGITAITAMIEQAKGIAQSAQSAAAGTVEDPIDTAAATEFVAGTASIDVGAMTKSQFKSISIGMGTLAVGDKITIGGEDFTMVAANPVAADGEFADETGLEAAVNAVLGGDGYTAEFDGDATVAVTLADADLEVADITAGNADANDVAAVAGDTIEIGANTYTAGTDFTDAASLATKIGEADYDTAVAGDVITVSKEGTTVAADEFTVTGGIVVDEVSETAASVYTVDGTDLTAGVDFQVAAGQTAGNLAAAIADAGLGAAAVEGTKVTVTVASPELQALQTQYNELLSQLTALAGDSGYKGKNLLDNDTLSVQFEGNTLDVAGFSSSAAGLGINDATWTVGGNVNGDLTQLDTALNTLSQESSKMSGNLSIITVRQEFSTNMINTLTEGSDKLTLADTNQEGANMLMLQTRQSLSTTALSLSAQAAQSVLRLFQ